MKLLALLCGLLVGGFAQAADVLHVTEAEGKKNAIEKPAPAYPIVARQLKLKGRVSVEATVTEDGTVSEVKTVAGNPILVKPALDAVKKWRFHPFEQQGKPAVAVVSLSFEFDTN